MASIYVLLMIRSVRHCSKHLIYINPFDLHKVCYYHIFHFTNEGTEAQRGQVTGPRSHSQEVGRVQSLCTYNHCAHIPYCLLNLPFTLVFIHGREGCGKAFLLSQFLDIFSV